MLLKVVLALSAGGTEWPSRQRLLEGTLCPGAVTAYGAALSFRPSPLAPLKPMQVKEPELGM